MKTTLILFIILTFISCRRKSNFENYLIGDKKWIYIDNKEISNSNSNMIVFTYNKFEKDGIVKAFYASNDTEKFGDMGKWNYSETDSIFTIYEMNFKVLKVYPDSFLLQNDKKVYKSLFIDNTKNIIKANR
jgi:hypothetical protein